MPTTDPATVWPNYREADFILKDYRFSDGKVLPELTLHYRTMGLPRKNAAGKIVNGVLLLQGNTGTGENWLRPSLADELFGRFEQLDGIGKQRPVVADDLEFHPVRVQGLTAEAGRPSRPTGSGATSRITATATWSIAAIASSPRGWGWRICGLSSAARWAGCTPGCGPRHTQI